MKLIKIKVIEPETVEVFINGSCIGDLNESEFLDLRCQIKRLKRTGFYIYHNGEKIMIRRDGFLERTVPIFILNLEKTNYLLGMKHNFRK